MRKSRLIADKASASMTRVVVWLMAIGAFNRAGTEAQTLTPSTSYDSNGVSRQGPQTVFEFEENLWADIRSVHRPSDKSLSKGLVPVACQFRKGLTGVLRNPGAGSAWPQVRKSAECGSQSSQLNRRGRIGSPMRAIAKNGHNSGAGFGAGLYRNLVRFGAILCNRT